MAAPRVIMQDVASVGLSSWDAEPFLKKVTDIVPNVIYIFNQLTQSNEYTNRSIGESLGYTGDEVREMGASLIPHLSHPDDLARLNSHFGQIITLADGEVIQIEYRLRHKRGHWVWLLSHDTVFDRDETGRVIRHIGVASDITPQKRAEERARAEHLKATTTNAELSAFSYSMSHDMKSPSNTLSLLLNELLNSHEDTLEPDAVHLINLAKNTVKRMGSLVDDVLEYTQIINEEFAPENTSLQGMVDSVLHDLDDKIRSQDVQLALGDLPTVYADPDQLKVLLRHLIENAIKFRKPGRSPQISIFAETSAKRDSCTLCVQDNGIGIAPERQEQVFTIFKRLGPNTEGSGTGLGLAICRRIAANHGSEVALTSAPGDGAKFSVRLAKE